MSDREKIIKAFEIHNDRSVDCTECPCNSDDSCLEDIMEDVLALLKEQEAIKPYMDYDGQDVWRCGKCGNSLMHPSYYESDEDAKNYIRYCSHCGRGVKWDD